MLDFPALCQLQLSRVLAASSLPQTSTLTNPSSASSTASMTALLVPEPCGGDVCSTSNSCGPLPQPQTRVVRKRRRGEVANPANTLDGLVAQKTNGEPISSRFLCENDAIESPDDVIELKKMEKDPDVCTRTCSVCGYQGKWVSEMIRHKRVHTNDRPFKCKYCSRTSKWKADLIRHVAKTHGIRVVSKYSRSKTFDGPGGEEEHSPIKSSSFVSASSSHSPVSCSQTLSYRCVTCHYEQEALSMIISHLQNAHGLFPYECESCGSHFETVETALGHSAICDSVCLKANLSTVYSNSSSSSISSASSGISPTSPSLSVDVEVPPTAPCSQRSVPSTLLSAPDSPIEASPADSLSNSSGPLAALLAPYLMLLGQLSATGYAPMGSAFTPTPAANAVESLRRLQQFQASATPGSGLDTPMIMLGGVNAPKLSLGSATTCNVVPSSVTPSPDATLDVVC